MILEWWMILLIFISYVFCLYFMYNKGYELGYFHGMKNDNYKSEMVGSVKLVKSLQENNIIKFLDDGTFIGFNNNEWNPITNKKYNPILDGDK